jgi:hypothetical protein
MSPRRLRRAGARPFIPIGVLVASLGVGLTVGTQLNMPDAFAAGSRANTGTTSSGTPAPARSSTATGTLQPATAQGTVSATITSLTPLTGTVVRGRVSLSARVRGVSPTAEVEFLVDPSGAVVTSAGSLTSIQQVANHGKAHKHPRPRVTFLAASPLLAVSPLSQQLRPISRDVQPPAVLVPVNLPINSPWRPAGSIIGLALLVLVLVRLFERRLTRRAEYDGSRSREGRVKGHFTTSK